MNLYKYLNDDGSDGMVIESSIPGLVVYPVDRTPAQAIAVTPQAADKIRQRVELLNKNSVQDNPIEKLTKRVGELQDKLDKLEKTNARQ